MKVALQRRYILNKYTFVTLILFTYIFHLIFFFLKNASDNFINVEENSSNELDREQGMHMSDVQEDAPGNSDDELGAIFDWY
jgi:hypothetical protein